MKVLVLGSGAREHAIAKRLTIGSAQRVWLGPGNGLADLDVETVSVRATEPEDVLRLVKKLGAELVVIGPEAPLLAGVADALADAGVVALGPKKAAAMLEGSKAFAKETMQNAHVPTAPFQRFTDVGEVERWLVAHQGAHVVKADGLMAGKGVTVCDDAEQALAAAKELLLGGQEAIVIEQRLRGKEVSLIALTDGVSTQLFPLARDHKRLLTGDRGKNTGGMGAFCPVVLGANEFEDERVLSPDELSRLCIEPVLHALPVRYRGFIYAGLMFDRGKVHVLEYNARLGDPETQALLSATDGDLLPAFYAAAVGDLAAVPAFHPVGAAVCVVLAARGYPDAPEKGAEINGVEAARKMPHVSVFGAAVKRDGARFFVDGGRVLSVVGHGASVAEAKARAYAAADRISFDGMQRREDIAVEDEPLSHSESELSA